MPNTVPSASNKKISKTWSLVLIKLTASEGNKQSNQPASMCCWEQAVWWACVGQIQCVLVKPEESLAEEVAPRCYQQRALHREKREAKGTQGLIGGVQLGHTRAGRGVEHREEGKGPMRMLMLRCGSLCCVSIPPRPFFDLQSLQLMLSYTFFDLLVSFLFHQPLSAFQRLQMCL